MRHFCLLLLAILVPVGSHADLKTCKNSTLSLPVDANGPVWSRQIAPKDCFKIKLSLPRRECSYSLEAKDEIPPPLKSTDVAALVAPLPPTIKIGPYILGKCERLELHVKCSATSDSAKDAIDNTFVVTTGQCGRWVTHYGLGFLSNEEEEFFTSAVTNEKGENAGFEIEQKADRQDLDTELVVNFTYLPGWSSETKLGRFGITAGLSVDLEKRLVYVGPSWVIGENINLFIALAGHQQSGLDGRYDVGQILKEDLSEDKLGEKTFGTSLIYGITFRFDNNPFKKKEAPKTSS